MDDTIHLSQLRDADVLLYRGTSVISRAIQFFDGSDASHAALYRGGGRVGEAIAEGLVERALAEGLPGNEWVEARRLKDRPANMAPVLRRGRHYLDQGNRYGFEQLLLLAFLCLTRKVKMTPIVRALVRNVLDAATSLLTRWVSEHKEPMICSEFVFRAYDEALSALHDRYALRVNRAMAGDLAETVDAQGSAGVAPRLSGPRGQGIHPDSLLAVVSMAPGEGWMPRLPAEELAWAREAPPVSDEQLDEQLLAYLAEVRTDEPALAVEEVTLDDLVAATDRFAYGVYQATHAAEAERLEAEAPDLASMLITDNLFRTAADFVTPADLLRTPSLFRLGRVVA
ncbi:MAG: hypothetical protein V1772_06605 [Chloroflexota bacterium]